MTFSETGRRRVLWGVAAILVLIPVFMIGTGMGQLEFTLWVLLLAAWVLLFRTWGKKPDSQAMGAQT